MPEFDIWAEKYRPQKISDIVGQPVITERLGSFIKTGLPNMLFAGPPGAGKTTAALCIAKELYGANWTYNFLELNASDQRGIDVIRSNVKDFARTRPIATDYKIICLDEADSLTADAQHALRRTMEKYSASTRFILIANYSSRIIEPIQSRCAMFRFKPLKEEQAIGFLRTIAEKESLKIEEPAFSAITRLSEGDMRRAINILQSSATLQPVTEKVVYDAVSAAQPKEVKEMLGAALKGDFLTGRARLLALLRAGIAGEDIIKEIARQVYDLSVPERTKVGLIEKIGEFEYRLAQGGNALIQLEALLARFAVLD